MGDAAFKRRAGGEGLEVRKSGGPDFDIETGIDPGSRRRGGVGRFAVEVFQQTGYEAIGADGVDGEDLGSGSYGA